MNRRLRKILDSIDPVDWSTYLYGKYGHLPIIIGLPIAIIIMILIVGMVWRRGVDNFRAQQAKINGDTGMLFAQAPLAKPPTPSPTQSPGQTKQPSPPADPTKQLPGQTNQTSSGANSPNVATGNNSQVTINSAPVTINNYFDNPDSKIRQEEAQLLRKYPLGYAVFAADATTIKLPRGLNYEKDFQISWEKVRVVRFDAKNVAINLPDFSTKDPLDPTIFFENELTLSRRTGSTFGLLLPGRAMLLTCEVLDNQDNFVVIVVGFAPYVPPKKN